MSLKELMKAEDAVTRLRVSRQPVRNWIDRWALGAIRCARGTKTSATVREADDR